MKWDMEQLQTSIFITLNVIWNKRVTIRLKFWCPCSSFFVLYLWIIHARLTGLARSVYILYAFYTFDYIFDYTASPHCRDPGCLNTAAERLAPARRQCSQIRKRAGNYRVSYIGPNSFHTIFHIYLQEHHWKFNGGNPCIASSFVISVHLF